MRAGTGFRGIAGVKSLQSDVTRRRRLMQDQALLDRPRDHAMVEAARMLNDIEEMHADRLLAEAG